MSIYEGHICRCCAADRPSKDLITAYNWMGEEEVYADMLRECFDINLDTGDEDGICELCITQLRNAFNFKKQVLQTEEQFKNKRFRITTNNDEIQIKEVKVKVEPLKDDFDGDDDADMDDAFGDQDSSSDYEVPIKEDPEQPPPKAPKRRGATLAALKKKAKPAAGPSKSYRECKIKIEGERTETMPINNGGTPRIVISGGRELRQLARMCKLPLAAPADAAMAAKIARLKKQSDSTELERLKANLATALGGSNATLLEFDTAMRFRCVNCSQSFPASHDLKTHNLEKHKDKKYDGTKDTSKVQEFLVKLDITGLKCNICDEKLALMDDLLSHLKEKHDKTVYNTLKKPFFQFDFSSPSFRCVFCSNMHSSLKALVEHQNSHFRYYVCKICDQGYVTERKLTSHTYRHKTGVYKCAACELVFDTCHKRMNHYRKAHMKPIARFRCPYCPMRFAYLTERKTHAAEQHGKEIVPQLKCTACDRMFTTATALSKHKRKDHLLEREHVCSVCSKSFFEKKMLEDHMVKHTGERTFECAVCFKAYGRKKTLREHMRIHADERRFACVHCGQQFVQKCSWKSHMRSKHDEVVQ